MEATDKSVVDQPSPGLSEHAPKYPAVLVRDEEKENCMTSSVSAVQDAPPFDYSVYSNPEFDGLPVLGPYRYMQTSHSNPAEPTVKFTYKGQYKNGLRHGAGKQVYPNGEVSEGYFYDAQPQFKGRKIFADGRCYCGDWKDGIVEGLGALYMPNGEWFAGQWKKDDIHGHGKFYQSNGSVHCGEFFERKIHGKGNSLICDGDSYVGQYQKGMFQGF